MALQYGHCSGTRAHRDRIQPDDPLTEWLTDGRYRPKVTTCRLRHSDQVRWKKQTAKRKEKQETNDVHGAWLG